MRRIKRLFFTMVTLLPMTLYAQNLNVVIASHDNKAFTIDVPSAKYQNGTKLQVWEHYSQPTNQHFQLRNSGGYVNIVCEYSQNLAFDVPSGKLESGNRIQIWDIYPNNNIQRWRLERIQGSIYVIHSALDDSYVLSLRGKAHNGCEVILEKYNGSNRQKWEILDVSSHLYSLYKNEYDKNGSIAIQPEQNNSGPKLHTIICPGCGGSGDLPWKNFITCKTCGGTGMLATYQ